MRLGIHLPQYGRASSADAITRVAQRAETLGYADVWVSDHVVVPADQGYPSPYLYEPLLSLAWAAAATDRVRLGTSVLVVPHHHPLSMANALASLDKLSGGRLTLGVGVGWSAAEFAALDQDFASRGARMDEALDIYRSAWETDPVSHDGGHYDFADMKLQPKPEARIPIWVGGLADVAIRRAARHDGYQGISSSPEEMKAIVQRLRDAGAGDDFAISFRTGWDPNGMPPEQICEEAAAYAEAGVQHVVSAPWRATADEWIDSMERLVELVPFEWAE